MEKKQEWYLVTCGNIRGYLTRAETVEQAAEVAIRENTPKARRLSEIIQVIHIGYATYYGSTIDILKKMEVWAGPEELERKKRHYNKKQ